MWLTSSKEGLLKRPRGESDLNQEELNNLQPRPPLHPLFTALLGPPLTCIVRTRVGAMSLLERQEEMFYFLPLQQDDLLLGPFFSLAPRPINLDPLGAEAE